MFGWPSGKGARDTRSIYLTPYNLYGTQSKSRNYYIILYDWPSVAGLRCGVEHGLLCIRVALNGDHSIAAVVDAGRVGVRHDDAGNVGTLAEHTQLRTRGSTGRVEEVLAFRVALGLAHGGGAGVAEVRWVGAPAVRPRPSAEVVEE